MNSLCLSRINRDLKEIMKSPLNGIGIVSLDNDPMKYIVNMKIMTGVFEGYCVQLLLTFTDKYPIKPPRILLYPGQGLDNENDNHFFKFCFYLLDIDFLPTSSVALTGWNPSYSISSLLLQVQIFLGKPDFPNGYIPEKEKIDKLMKSMENYQNIFIITNDKNEKITKVHTWKNPYPEIFYTENYLDKINININESNKNKKLIFLKENLTCFISKINFIDDRNIILGYPIKVLREGAIIPIPEILSSKGFIENSSNKDSNITIIPLNIFTLRMISINRDRIINTNSFKSANNELYKYWLPIYINDDHFEKNKTTILNYFNSLKQQNEKITEYIIQPYYIFEIMLKILSEMMEKIIKGKNISSSFLICFFQYILMFKKLEKKYNDIFIQYQNYYLEKPLKFINIKETKIAFYKFLILFFFSSNEIYNDTKIKIRKFIENSNENLILNLFLNNNINNYINIDFLIRDVKKFHLLNKIGSLIFYYKIKDFVFSPSPKDDFFSSVNKIKKIIIQKISIDFSSFYNSLSKKIKLSINKILVNKLKFSDYLNITDLNKFKSKSKEFFRIFEMLREKIIAEKFLDDLENNFGIYLDSENFVKELYNENDLSFMDKYNNLKKYELFSIIEKNILLQFYQGQYKNLYNSFDNFSIIKCLLSNNYNDKFLDQFLFPLKFILSQVYFIDRHKKEKKDIYKEMIKRDRIIIKDSYDKTYNKRITKFTNKKDIKRLLLYKRNHH